MKTLLAIIDRSIYAFLKKNVHIMPLRFVKLVAYYYTDARIRKLYLEKLGVITGEDTYSNLGLLLAADGSNKPSVFIGNRVSIATGVTFVSDSCPNNSQVLQAVPYVKEKLIKGLPITIEDDVWIGANVTILPGVTVGRCSIVGAGSLVLQDVEPYCIYAGIPAKKIRELSTISSIWGRPPPPPRNVF
jgi:maltose O-acetyltransferase